MGTTLSQMIAVAKGVKSKAESEFTASYQKLQKGPLTEGLTRTYRPADDDGEQLPKEAQKVQVSTRDEIKKVADSLERLFNVVATIDMANTSAASDVVVEGKVIAHNVPATTLIFIEKKLTDIHTFVSKLPVLDPTEDWTLDPNTGLFKTPAVETASKKKQKKVLIKYEATEKHPAQTETYDEDVIVGYWSKVRTSGALPKPEVAAMLERVTKLQEAVIFAREQANSLTITDSRIGESILDYVFNM